MTGYGTGSPFIGPYGTNVGDIWLSDGSPVQDKLDADGKGLKLVHRVDLREGRPEETIFVTADPEIIQAAREGTRFYWLQRASEN